MLDISMVVLRVGSSDGKSDVVLLKLSGPCKTQHTEATLSPGRYVVLPFSCSRMRSASGIKGASDDAPFTIRLFSANPLAHRTLPPSADDATNLRGALHAALDGLGAADLGVCSEDTSKIAAPSGIGYQGVYAGPEMTLCIFILRKGAVIPLHDHPGMHVYGRLLFGRLRVRSYDPEGPFDPGTRRAVLRSDTVIGPSPTTYSLGPEEGNVHELEALEASAFFDVLTPSYDPRTGRDCNYYRREGDVNSKHCVLLPVDLWDFSMDTLAYRGPAFTP